MVAWINLDKFERKASLTVDLVFVKFHRSSTNTCVVKKLEVKLDLLSQRQILQLLRAKKSIAIKPIFESRIYFKSQHLQAIHFIIADVDQRERRFLDRRATTLKQ